MPSPVEFDVNCDKARTWCCIYTYFLKNFCLNKFYDVIFWLILYCPTYPLPPQLRNRTSQLKDSGTGARAPDEFSTSAEWRGRILPWPTGKTLPHVIQSPSFPQGYIACTHSSFCPPEPQDPSLQSCFLGDWPQSMIAWGPSCADSRLCIFPSWAPWGFSLPCRSVTWPFGVSASLHSQGRLVQVINDGVNQDWTSLLFWPLNGWSLSSGPGCSASFQYIALSTYLAHTLLTCLVGSYGSQF